MRWMARGDGHVAATLVLALAAALLVTGLREAAWLQPLELWAYDRKLALRIGLTGAGEPGVVVVGIDEAALQRYGDPVADGVLAHALAAIAADRPTAIGLDLFRDLAVRPGTAALEQLFRDTDALVVVYAVGGPGVRFAVPPPPSVTAEARLGFADVPLDGDGVVRRGLLFVGGGDSFGTSLALRLAERVLAPQGIGPTAARANPRWLQLGAATYAPLPARRGLYQAGEAGGYQFLLSFPAGANGIEFVTFADVVEGALPAGRFTDRVVLIGLTDTIGARDILQVPVALQGGNARRLPGVALHAHMTTQLIREATGTVRPLAAVGDRATALLALATAALAAGLALLPAAPWLRAALAVGLALALTAGGAASMVAGLWVSTPALLLVLALAFTSGMGMAARRHFRERAAVFRLFGLHLSPRIAAIAWAERETFLDHGLPPPQELTATVLFSDLAGFTGISQQLPPPELMRWINRYVGEITSIVDAHGGVVEKYSGDGVMAVFGIPIPRRDEAEIDTDARAAADVALAMAESLARLNQRNVEDGLPTMRMRIGIATGRLVAGTTGGINRLQYTVLGDAANVAARLESYRKDEDAIGCDGGHVRILLSAATMQRLGAGYAVHPYETEAALRGRGGAIAVYRLAAMHRDEPASEVTHA